MSSSSVNLCKQLIRKNYDNLTFVKRYFSSSSSTTITGKIYSTVDDDNNQIGRIKISNPSKLLTIDKNFSINWILLKN